MHTTLLTDPNARHQQWVVIHNSDWSGTAYLRNLELEDEGRYLVITEVEVPGEVFVTLALRILESRPKGS